MPNPCDDGVVFDLLDDVTAVLSVGAKVEMALASSLSLNRSRVRVPWEKNWLATTLEAVQMLSRCPINPEKSGNRGMRVLC